MTDTLSEAARSTTRGALTTQLWKSIEGIYAEILAHPFITGLTDGTLPEKSFRFYVVQDALYLTRYARALSVCAARAPHEEAIRMFSEHAAEAITVERSLHDGFFAEFGLSPEEVAATPLAPTNVTYTSYLLATVYGGSFAEALGAVLPCYWIYWEVGKALLAKGSPNRLYQRWIDTYGGEEFGATVQAVLDLTDAIAADLGPADRRAMTEHFVMTSRLEWMFWDMGYRQERWPDAVAPKS
ncbi:MAG TPA: thiaminase II [Thermomicrobiales bacterium]